MNENEKRNAALEAVSYIKDGQVIGLGSGSTAYFAIQKVGALVKAGLQIKAIPTSKATQQLAEALHIPLIDINSVEAIDITIDGADEFTKDLFLIKGGGGALLHEKIVAAMTKQEIIIADSSKLVEKLGKFKVPIEVIPFAENQVVRQLKKLNGIGTIRKKKGQPFTTDQGNIIIDADFGLINHPIELANKLDTIIGIVEHGLFINLTTLVICGEGEITKIFTQ